jgi:hypothetical protein
LFLSSVCSHNLELIGQREYHEDIDHTTFTLWVSNENRHSGAGRNPGNGAESGGDQFWTPACAGVTELPFLGSFNERQG